MDFIPAISRRGSITPSSIRKKVTTVTYCDGGRQRLASKWADAPGGRGAIWAVRLDGTLTERRAFIKLYRARLRDGGYGWVLDDSPPYRPGA